MNKDYIYFLHFW